MIGKKGTIDDKLYMLMIFAFIVILVGTIYVMYTPIYNVLYGLDVSTNAALDNISPTSVYGWIDWTVVVGYFGFNILICIVLPFMVRHNPIYLGAIFIFSFIYALVAAIVVNSLYDFLTSVGASYTGINFILSNFVVIESVFILLMAVVMFFKYRTAGSGDMYYGE